MLNKKTNMKHNIKICMGSSCFARGNQKNLDLIEKMVSKYQGEFEIELLGNRCENRCNNGPNVEIDGKLYNRIDFGSLVDLLNDMISGK